MLSVSQHVTTAKFNFLQHQYGCEFVRSYLFNQRFMSIDNHNNHINTFINNKGFAEESNLLDLLDNDDDAEEIRKWLAYLGTHAHRHKLYKLNSKLSIIK